MIFTRFIEHHSVRQQQGLQALRLAVFFFFMVPVVVCANPSFEKFITVTVAKNDNLVTICEKYLENPNDWQKIARINRLKNPHLIYPDDTLEIPSILLKGTPLDGFVTFLKGQVMFQSPSATDWRELQMGDAVSQGTQLKTGRESSVEITFEDGASFFLRPETTVSLPTSLKKASHYIIRKLFMPVGKTLIDIKKSTGQESRFEIKTPSAVSAARGTMFRVSADQDEITRTEVLEGVVGVDAMKRGVLLDHGEGTWVKKGEAPKLPITLLLPPSPVNLKPLYQVLPSGFALTPVDNAVSYRVVLSTDTVFKNVVNMQTPGPSGEVLLENLEDGIYYCQAASVDRVGLEGIPSRPFAFEIRVNPLPPFIQKPLDGQELRKDTVTLEWLNVHDAKSYQIQVAKDPEFKDVIMDVDGITDTRKKILLKDFSSYYFRVRSIAMDEFRGVWSDAIGFVFLEPPKAPPVETPKMDESKVNIRWQALGDGISYHFQMAKDPLFKEIIKDCSTEKPNISFERPQKAGTYHIRISAIDSHGYEGKFTPPQSFEIKRSPYWDIGAVVSWGLVMLVIIL